MAATAPINKNARMEVLPLVLPSRRRRLPVPASTLLSRGGSAPRLALEPMAMARQAPRVEPLVHPRRGAPVCSAPSPARGDPGDGVATPDLRLILASLDERREQADKWQETCCKSGEGNPLSVHHHFAICTRQLFPFVWPGTNSGS
ncbi:hypothetical protein SORBI_3004G349450 [Sorghum bicolor]|uniref:Uncharacterized protein n=1 Tax=Sorghum bicolor TaxID=4558 RepID=A0A1Z5RRF9_SORBI|nr:hypothetical protein SORBI_3004G349450 [Sorghum bicolor]